MCSFVCRCVMCVQPKLLGDAVLAPVRTDGGRYLHDDVSLVFRHSSSHSVVVHAALHCPLSRGTRRLRPAADTASLAAVLGRLRQARHASPTSAHQLPAVLHVVRQTVRHRVSGSACVRVPTADADRLGEKTAWYCD